MNADWRRTTWGELIELKYGKALRDYKNGTGEYPVFGTNGAVGSCDKALCPFPGIIIGRKGAYRGVHFSDKPFFVIDTAYYVNPKADFNMKWAYYHLLHQDINNLDSGSAIPSTSREDVYQLSAFVPPRRFQDYMVRVLDSLNEKIQINHKINQTLEQMAQAIFKSWFVDFEPVKAKIAALEADGSEEVALLAAMKAISGKGEAELTRLQAEQPEQYAELRATAELFPSAMQDSELGEIPEGWTITPFSSIARLDTTSVKPAQDPERVWEHYSIPAFDEGATPAFETGADIKSNKYKVYPTAVLSSKLNPHFPRTWIPDVQNSDAAICSTEFMQFVPRESQHRAFIAGMVTSEPFQSGIMMRVTGSTGSRQRAQPKQVAAMDVILPKSELRAAYSQHTEAMYRTQSKNIWQARSLSSLRDTLLPKLLSGELSVIDAENQLTEEERMPQEEIN